jgi:hypothetical protein
VKINFFADDSLLYVATRDVKEAENIMKELGDIFEWLSKNKLKMNPDKTKMMVLTNKTSINKDDIKISIDGGEIERVTSMKYLGIIIDDWLNMHESVQFICKEEAKKINYLACLGRKVNDMNKVTIYNAIIGPHFEFCSSLLLMCTNDDLNK